MPAGGELETCERVAGDRVGLDAGDVAVDDGRAALLEQRADAGAEAGQVGARDRAPNGERDRVGRRGSHDG